MIFTGSRGPSHSDLLKVRFPLDRSDWKGVEAENLWAEPLTSGQYRLRNSPFYIYGISAEDVVYANEVNGTLNFTGVARRGGHSTYRILLPKDTSIESQQFLSHWEPLERLGCTYEVAKKRWLAVDIPPHVNIYEAYELLEKGEADHAWDFEEGHCGHAIQKR